MKELFVISVDASMYGVWKDDVLHLREISHVHDLPLTPEGVSGVCLVDNDTSILFDLGLCLGHSAFDRRGPGRAFMMSETKRSEGFIFEGEATRFQIPPEEVFAVPDCLQGSGFDECVFHAGHLLPVVNIAVLYQRLREKRWERPVVDFQDPGPPPNVSSADAFRVCELCGMAFGVPDDLLEAEATRPGPIRRILLAPPYVEGIVLQNERVSMVLNPARYMGLNLERDRHLLLLTKSGGLGFLVDADRGVLRGKVTPQPMPPLTSSDFMAYGLVRDREVIPLLNIHALVSRTPERLSSDHYTPESRIASIFGKQEVEILEFSLLGMRLGVPASEVEDVVDFKPSRKIGGVPSIILGVAEHGGEILPVLDLAACFGRRTEATADSKMILLKNGNFRALVVTQAISNKRLLAVEEQKHVPIAQRWPYVHGCYLDGETIGLILNVEALTTHFEETQVQAFFAMLDQEYDASWTGTESESGEVEADVADVVSDSDGAEEEAPESREAEQQTVAAFPAEDLAAAEEAAPAPPAWDEMEPSPVVPEPAAPMLPQSPVVDTVESRKTEPAQARAMLSDTADQAPQTTTLPVQVYADALSERKGQRWGIYAAMTLLLAALLFWVLEMRKPHTEKLFEGMTAFTDERQIGEQEAVSAVEEHDSLEWQRSHLDREAAPTVGKMPSVVREEFHEARVAVPPVEQTAPVVHQEELREARIVAPAENEEAILLMEIEPAKEAVSLRIVTTPPVGAQLYVVKKGDTLWDIAERFTGNPFHYPAIAADSHIHNPDLIFPEQKIFINIKGE